MSSSLAGAEIITFLAPASMCFCASAAFVNMPVDSTTTSTPIFAQGIFAGSRSALTNMFFPSTVIDESSKETGLPNLPRIESYFKRWARVALSVRSFMPTISNLAPDAKDARRKLRPIRPNPLIPTLSISNPINYSKNDEFQITTL